MNFLPKKILGHKYILVCDGLYASEDMMGILELYFRSKRSNCI